MGAVSYFHRVQAETPTRLWINNPSAEDTRRALAAGAISCTTNPSYCSKLLQSEPAYIRGVIDEVIRDEEDNDAAAELAYLRCAERLIKSFRPLFESSRGMMGYVTVQGDPRRDEEPEDIVDVALRASRLGPNLMAKIPVTEAGMVAIEELVASDVACCATEVFSVSQAIEICQRYQKATSKSGNHPPFYVTHITGIFDQYLGELCKSEHVAIAPEILAQAGTAVCKRQYQVLRELRLPGVMLGGGARSLKHFTEFVGGDMHITINMKEVDELLTLDPPVERLMDTPTPAEVVQELVAKAPNFRRSYEPGALHPHEFESFGPLMFFKAMFLNGWVRLVDEVAMRRALST